ncbi:MAG TPA: response regulator transcription factor [Planctomycetes bacterium]|nr:response regulator transcription factor [Planctomycetota bacterium]
MAWGWDWPSAGRSSRSMGATCGPPITLKGALSFTLSFPQRTDAMIDPAATVYIIDDDPAARDAVTALVRQMGLRAQAFASAEQFLETYDGTSPGCLITDLRMLGISGVELLERMVRAGTPLPVIIITAYPETPVTVRAMQLGAVTLLEKPCADHQLWEAIRDALERDARRRAGEARRREIRARIDQLTPRERDVLRLIVEGKANKQIAKQLGVSLRTVEAHRHNIFEKLQAHSVAELVRLVLETGLSDRDPFLPRGPTW